MIIPVLLRCTVYSVQNTFQQSILCLWNVQLTFDWDWIEPRNERPSKSELNCCIFTQIFFLIGQF